MKKLPVFLIGFMFVLAMTSDSIAESYWVHGADNAEEINGLYEYYGTYNTFKSDGQYSHLDMPVYKKSGGDYWLGYRG
ncbi:MAG: hypothetical protein JRI70_00120 [Deltaproteobacteria bacterium]|nr:hypothetical protein [Deltaproteobacteria bacterium]MBW1858500.1 hypothetical protein [Deltaproteobacteria bacterium]